MTGDAAQDAMGSHLSKFSEALIALIPAAFAFILGWAYLTSYLARFSVDITEVEVPLVTTFIFSYPVILRVDFIATIIVLGVFIYFIKNIPPNNGWRILCKFSGYIVCFGATVSLIPLYAEVAAMQKADAVWRGSSFEARLSVKDEGNKEWIADYRKCAAERRLKFVFGTPSGTILICRSKYTPCNYGDVYTLGSDGTLKSRRGVNYAAKSIWLYDSWFARFLDSPGRVLFGSGDSITHPRERDQCVGAKN